MSNVLPPVLNLAELARLLPEGDHFRRLRMAIRKVATVQSCTADLGRALASTNALRRLRDAADREETIDSIVIHGALLMQAIVFYARATNTSGRPDERGGVNISSKLTEQQLIDHKALIDIRNRAISHVVSDGEEADFWHNTRNFLHLSPEGWRHGSGNMSINFHPEAFERLQRQLPVAHAAMNAKFNKRSSDLTNIFKETPPPGNIWEAAIVDPHQFFVTTQVAERALAIDPAKGEIYFQTKDFFASSSDVD